MPPVDSLHDVRSAMCLALEDMGLSVEVHHHEVATAGQAEIGVAFDSLVRKADEVQILKYVVQNVAHAYGKTATFMPKPLVGDNGNGMHVHQSLAKNGENIFTGDGYGGLSETALYYIGGVLKHAKAIECVHKLRVRTATNVSSRDSRRRRCWPIRPRTGRRPYVFHSSPIRKARRIEVRWPDSSSNPYFAFAAMLMAGIDGIQNKIHPGEAMDKDLYDLPPEEEAEIRTVAFSLDQAIDSLDKDREFLLAGDDVSVRI